MSHFRTIGKETHEVCSKCKLKRTDQSDTKLVPGSDVEQLSVGKKIKAQRERPRLCSLESSTETLRRLCGFDYSLQLIWILVEYR